MKVIGKDNFDRETVSDILIKENVTEEEGKKIVEEHNAKMGDYGQWFYVLVKDDHKLYDCSTIY